MAAYLPRCLDSILASTYRNLEVICVDDGSTDDSAQILRRYASEDSRFVVISKPNGGVSSARNAGLARMTGEFVSFFDPDDFLHPQFFELLMRAIQAQDADYGICRILPVEEADLPVEMPEIPWDPQKAKAITLREMYRDLRLFVYCTGRVVKTSLVAGAAFQTEYKVGEDTLFTAEVCTQNPQMRIVTLPYDLYYYYQRPGSAFQARDEMERLKIYACFADRVGKSPENDIVYLNQTCRSVINMRYIARYIRPSPDIVRECGRILRVCRQYVPRASSITFGEKIYILVSIRSMGINRLYRILRDPGMRKWERVERRKLRESKKIRATIP